MLPIRKPDRLARSREVRAYPAGRATSHRNHPYRAVAGHRGAYRFRSYPIRHLRSVRRVLRVQTAPRHQPGRTSECWNLIDAAAIPVRLEDDPGAVRRKIGRRVARAIEGQTDRLATGNLPDIQI